MTSQTRLAARPATAADERGFSLPELLTVIVLIGIFAAMAVPRIDNTQMKLNAAMHQVSSQLLSAQRLAVARQHDVVLAVDVPGARLRVHLDRDNDGAIDPGESVTWHALELPVVLGRGGAPTAAAIGIGLGPQQFSNSQNGLPAIVFRRSGSASEEGGLYLTSTRAARGDGYETDTRAVRIEHSTGHVSWYHWTGREWKEGSA